MRDQSSGCFYPIADQWKGSQARNHPVKVGGSWPCLTCTTAVCWSRPLGSVWMYSLAAEKETAFTTAQTCGGRYCPRGEVPGTDHSFKSSPHLTDSAFSTSLASFPIQTNTWNRRSVCESSRRECVDRKLLPRFCTWSHTSNSITSSSARSSWVNSPGTSSICTHGEEHLIISFDLPTVFIVSDV